MSGSVTTTLKQKGCCYREVLPAACLLKQSISTAVSSLGNLKNRNKLYWKTNVIAIIVLKPKLLNALKFWLILKNASLIWTPFLMKSDSHQKLNILTRGNPIHIFHLFSLLATINDYVVLHLGNGRNKDHGIWIIKKIQQGSSWIKCYEGGKSWLTVELIMHRSLVIPPIGKIYRNTSHK